VDIVESYTDRTKEGVKSRLPARLDYFQSATGLFLALFMVAHMFLVSSILISKDFMYSVTKALEGAWIFGEGEPLLVSIAVAGVFAIFIIHAGLAMRKFPINYAQFMKYRVHMKTLKHSDTSLWFTQAMTGFIMFFLGSVHLYIMMSQPANIGPFASADRMISEWMWPLYLVLLFAVELHGSIGLYRLAVKWGWFDGADPRATRKRLKAFKVGMSFFFIALGLATLLAYMKIGIDHKDKAGERYSPTALYVDGKGVIA